MLLPIEDNVLEKVNCLKSFPNEVIIDFCKVSIGGIFKPINQKTIKSVANKLSIEEDIIRHCLVALSKIFLQASKLQVSKEDITTSLKIVGFSEEVATLVGDRYDDRKNEVKSLLLLRGPPIKRFKDLTWRFDIKMASRSAYDQCQAYFLIKLHTTTNRPYHHNLEDNFSKLRVYNKEQNETENGSREENFVNESFVFELSPPSLNHILRRLEDAVRESKRNKIKRIIENF